MPGFLPLLAIVFITLKLLDLVAWSWWLVLAPLWLPSVLFLAFALGYIIFHVLFGRA